MEQLSKVVHITVYSISFYAVKSSAKRALGPIVLRPSNNFHPTATATSCRG